VRHARGAFLLSHNQPPNSRLKRMEQVFQCSLTGLRAMLIRGLGPERDCAERDLMEAGVPLALSHQAVWSAHVSRAEPWFLQVRDECGRARGGLAVEVVRTRAMPGYVILRVGRCGENMPQEICNFALGSLQRLVAQTPRVLRLQVNVFSREHRQTIGATLEGLGFREVRPPTSYRYTLAIDLKPTEEEILAGFSKSARKRIRETMKPPLQAGVITCSRYAEKLKELQHEAVSRTSGHTPGEDWTAILKMSEQHPDLSRVSGLFLDEDLDPQKLVAFSWACNHGNYVEYRAAASTRKTADRIPSGYRMVWEQVRWSKSLGAQWFDMGGVTMGADDEPSLNGISEFKRFFTQDAIEVGAEWVFEPSPVWSGIATVVSNAAQTVRGWMEKSSMAPQ
jgi:hypothetical protein